MHAINLTLVNVTSEDNGFSLTCIAENVVGMSNASVALTVHCEWTRGGGGCARAGQALLTGRGKSVPGWRPPEGAPLPLGSWGFPLSCASRTPGLTPRPDGQEREPSSPGEQGAGVETDLSSAPVWGLSGVSFPSRAGVRCGIPGPAPGSSVSWHQLASPRQTRRAW